MSRTQVILTVWISLLGIVPPVSACSIWCALEFAPGPKSTLEMLLVLPVAAIVMVAFGQALRYTLRPGERAAEHIKWRILQEDSETL